jgi:ElaB/YqjD/DUF883 family membrane-anchored ribosome-binding protein
MFNRPNRNDINDDAQDIRNDVSQLADTLEEVLKSWGSDAKDEADAAKRKAQSLLRETRARLNGRTRHTGCLRCGQLRNDLRARKTALHARHGSGSRIFVGALLSLRK